MPPVSPLLTVMVGAARKAGRSLARDFGEVENLQVSKKGPSDFVSAADRRAEEVIFAELSRVRPGYGFLMEERGVIEGSDRTHRWIVDQTSPALQVLAESIHSPEVVRHTKYPIYGFQFHPEKMQDKTFGDEIFEAFVNQYVTG